MNKFGRRFKYICSDCSEATRFSHLEQIRAAGMQCRFCGSRRLEPSQHSFERHNQPIFHDKKTEYDKSIMDKKYYCSPSKD